jgi:Pentapeptide repeats (8 copies)
MRWLKRGMWRAAIAMVGLLLLLVLTVWVPVSVGAYGGESVPPQVTPTIDVTATMTALNEEKLRQEIQQLKNQNGNQNNWLANNSTALIAAVATVIVALFGILQWAITVRQAQDKDLKDREEERRKEVAAQDKELKDRQIAQDKDLRAQAEERFKNAIAALGDEKEGTQVAGAILLRSFLNKEDKEIYGRYYIQIFDLAVAYLRLLSIYQPVTDPDLMADLPATAYELKPRTPLRQALTVVFKEVFPLARSRLGQMKERFETQSLDASDIRLDEAFLVASDLKRIWMQDASLSNATLIFANLRDAVLAGADLSGADLSGADLRRALLTRAKLYRTNLTETDMTKADLTGVRGLEIIESLKDTDLRGVKGLTKEQLAACKAKGAIIDEDTTTGSPQPVVSPVSLQSSAAQPPSASSTQATTLPTNTDGGSNTSSQPSAEP